MIALQTKALAGFLNLFIVVSLSLFLPAWSLDFPEAWVYLLVFFGAVSLITLYFLGRDPDLIQRRLKAGPFAERRPFQKLVQFLASLCFLLLFIIPGFDHRLHWSSISPILIIAGDLCVLSGLFVVFLAFRENSYSSALIETGTGQKVIATGPYAVVRHPMYTGAVLLILFTPIALSSWWGMLPALALLAVVILRLLDEERFLTSALPGYREYCHTVRRRLLPGVW